MVEKYRIEKPIGEGGMARVYRVCHETLGTRHALKVLLTANARVDKRLMLEGRIQATLRHANIVAVTDVLHLEDGTGLIMDFIRGPTLAHILEGQPLSWEQIDDLAAGIFRGVAHAHSQGLIHRDLKPENILCEVQGTTLVPKIADFGLVKEAGGVSNTRTGMTMGTPRYMAPEQIKDAKNVDHLADVFSLGAILYEMITRVPAFAPDADDAYSVFSAVMENRYQPLLELREGVPTRMIEAISCALAPDKTERFQSVMGLSEAFLGKSLSSSTWDVEALRSDLTPVHPGRVSEPTFFAETPGGAPRREPAAFEHLVQPTLADAQATSFPSRENTHFEQDAPAAESAPPTTPIHAPVSETTERPGPNRALWVGVAGVCFLAFCAVGAGIALVALPDGEVPSLPTPVASTSPPPQPTEALPVPSAPDAATPTPVPPEAVPRVPVPVAPTPAPVAPKPEAVAPRPALDPEPAAPDPEPTAPDPEPTASDPEPEPAAAEPEPAPAPDPEPVAPEPEPSTTALFRVAGDEVIFLQGGNGTFSPGDAVPPGTYLIRRRAASGKFSNVGKATLAAGDSVQIRCTALGTCSAAP